MPSCLTYLLYIAIIATLVNNKKHKKLKKIKSPSSFRRLLGQFSKGGAFRMTSNPIKCQARTPKKPDPEAPIPIQTL